MRCAYCKKERVKSWVSSNHRIFCNELCLRKWLVEKQVFEQVEPNMLLDGIEMIQKIVKKGKEKFALFLNRQLNSKCAFCGASADVHYLGKHNHLYYCQRHIKEGSEVKL